MELDGIRPFPNRRIFYFGKVPTSARSPANEDPDTVEKGLKSPNFEAPNPSSTPKGHDIWGDAGTARPGGSKIFSQIGPRLGAGTASTWLTCNISQ
jgi:hypothetical protein